MIITNCPKCGSMNITTAGVCANCGWSQFAKVTKVSTPIEDALRKRIAELEKALNIDTDLTIAGLRKELRDATTRIAELEHRNKVLEDACEMLRKENGRVTQLLDFWKGLSTNGRKVQE